MQHAKRKARGDKNGQLVPGSFVVECSGLLGLALSWRCEVGMKDA